MARPIAVLIAVIIAAVDGNAEEVPAGGGAKRLAELDAYWAEVSRSVREGDFEGYEATCHPEGVLVSGISSSSYPLSDALRRWKEGFEKTKAGEMKAAVNFRFHQRLGDESTAHESGIFRYQTEDKQGGSRVEYIHFEALLVKSATGWKILMEYQKARASEKEWGSATAD